LLKATLPVTAVGSVTVRVTDWLTNDGLAEDVNEIEGVPLFTAWTSESTEVL
jgi:hypothetical protein